MPNFDGTGPAGMGPMTGRGYGPCGFGLGWRRRFGAGRGMGRYFGWNWPQTPQDQKKALADYKKALEEELEDIKKEEEEIAKQA
ncbi:MAG: DUF5320 domain-containing protein [bacterium]